MACFLDDLTLLYIKLIVDYLKNLLMINPLKLRLPVVMILFSAILPACNKNETPVLPVDPVPINLTADQINLIKSENTFAFNLFGKVLKNSDKSKNIIVSPLSVSYALSMAVNGAAGVTRDSILKALAVSGITPDAINNSYKVLTEALLSVDPRVIMKIANSVWTENDFPVKKSFMDILTEYYKSESETFDISDPAAPAKMNLWIENNTNGLIKNMIEDLDDNTVMLLINAIYFKGKWKSQFDPAKTQNEPFIKNGGEAVNVPMMKQNAEFKVLPGDGFYMAEFPYGQGNFVMDVILPDGQSGIEALAGTLNDHNFSDWISQLHQTKIDVAFPKFKYMYKLSLKNILSSMGMRQAFTDQADFSNISEAADLLINDVAHQAFIETNEEGTEAAAATAVIIGTTSMPFQLKFDHPFIYIIRETTTNSILFMGRVSDPASEG